MVINGNSQEDAYVKGFAITAEEVLNVKDKSFEILGVRTIEKKDTYGVDPEKMISKVILDIKFNKEVAEYFPNRTSMGKIVAQRGRKKVNWIGYKGIFVVREIQMGKELKKAVYIE